MTVPLLRKKPSDSGCTGNRAKFGPTLCHARTTERSQISQISVPSLDGLRFLRRCASTSYMYKCRRNLRLIRSRRDAYTMQQPKLLVLIDLCHQWRRGESLFTPRQTATHFNCVVFHEHWREPATAQTHGNYRYSLSPDFALLISALTDVASFWINRCFQARRPHDVGRRGRGSPLGLSME